MIGLFNVGKMPKVTKFSLISRRQYFFTASGFRPREQSVSKTPFGSRCATFEAGENKTGHITAGPNEDIFFFDSMNRSPACAFPPSDDSDRYIPSKTPMAHADTICQH
jgi:hypothetical protein